MPSVKARQPDVDARAASGGEGQDHAERMQRIAFALHEMCQPLMALQCRLEIGRMVGTADGYEEAVREGLLECDRLIESVSLLRDEVRIGLEASLV